MVSVMTENICTPTPRESMGSITEFKMVDKGRVLRKRLFSWEWHANNIIRKYGPCPRLLSKCSRNGIMKSYLRAKQTSGQGLECSVTPSHWQMGVGSP